MTPTLTSTATVSSTEGKEGLEALIHRLKLQWIMAKDDAERRRISEEIRKKSATRQAK